MARFHLSSLMSLLMTLLVFLFSCSAPTDKRIAADFKEVFSREAGYGITPVITSSGPGEGDSDNVYQHVKFDVTVDADVDIATGWFAGQSLKQGRRLHGGELVMLYQKDKAGQWQMTWYELKRRPQMGKAI